MSDFVYDAALGTLGGLDAAAAVLVVVGPGYAPLSSHETLADIADELGREDTLLAVTTTAGEVRVDLDDDVSVDISAATLVGGWVLATDGATDADRHLIRWAENGNTTVADPYVVSCPDGVALAVAV